jgi:hypothetical protein
MGPLDDESSGNKPQHAKLAAAAAAFGPQPSSSTSPEAAPDEFLGSTGEPDLPGTKHFSPGTVVYVLPFSSYDVASYERALVLGRHRVDGRLARVWVDLRRLEGFSVAEELEPDLEVAIRREIQDQGVEPWTSASAVDFVGWRNSSERLNWDDVVRSNQRQESSP